MVYGARGQVEAKLSEIEGAERAADKWANSPGAGLTDPPSSRSWKEWVIANDKSYDPFGDTL